MIAAALIALCMVSLYVAARVAISLCDDRAAQVGRIARATQDRTPVASVAWSRNRLGDN